MKFLKQLYWQWVASCCREGLETIRDAMPWLNFKARQQALRERRQALRELRHAGEELAKLKG